MTPSSWTQHMTKAVLTFPVKSMPFTIVTAGAVGRAVAEVVVEVVATLEREHARHKEHEFQGERRYRVRTPPSLQPAQ